MRTKVDVQGLKYVFYQDIYRLPDEKLCLKGVVTTTSLINGRLAVSEYIKAAFDAVIAKREWVES